MFYYAKFISMQPHEQDEELALLETELARYRMLLDESIEANEEFRKTKEIFHELNKIRVKIDEIKRRKMN